MNGDDAHQFWAAPISPRDGDRSELRDIFNDIATNADKARLMGAAHFLIEKAITMPSIYRGYLLHRGSHKPATYEMIARWSGVKKEGSARLVMSKLQSYGLFELVDMPDFESLETPPNKKPATKKPANKKPANKKPAKKKDRKTSRRNAKDQQSSADFVRDRSRSQPKNPAEAVKNADQAIGPLEEKRKEEKRIEVNRLWQAEREKKRIGERKIKARATGREPKQRPTAKLKLHRKTNPNGNPKRPAQRCRRR